MLCLLCPRVSVCASILAPHLPQSTSCFLLSPCFSYASVLNTQHQSFIRCRRDDVDVDSNGVGDDGVVCGGAAQIFFHRDAQTNGSQSAQKPLDETLEANTSFSHPHATLLLRSTTERVETTGRPTPPASHCAHGCVCVRERERERERGDLCITISIGVHAVGVRGRRTGAAAGHVIVVGEGVACFR